MANEQQLVEGIRRADAAGDSDGVKALGAELLRVRAQGNAPQAQAQAQAQAQGPQAESSFGTFVRSAFNGITAGWGDKIGAAQEAIIPGIGNAGTQTMWDGHSFSDAYAHNAQLAHAQTQSNDASHPYISGAGNIGGAIALGAGTAGFGEAAGLGRLAQMGTAGRLAAAVAPDVAYGASYGAGQSDASTVAGQATDVAYGAAGGLAGHAVGAVAGKVIGGLASGVTDPIKRQLADAGVQFTPGQALGGTAGHLEQLATSVPVVGTMIKNRLAESGQQWNTATLNRALEPYEAKIPEGVTGSDAFAYGQKAVDNTFDNARSGLVVTRNPEFDNGLQAIQDKATSGGVDALPEAYQQRFNNVIDNNVLRKFNADGVMSANDYTKAASDLRTAARKQMVGNNPADAQDYGKALNSLADHLDTAALNNPASNPAAVASLKNAREAYPLWALAQSAADKSGPQNAGAFNPTQYLRAVESSDQTVRNHAFTEGNALDQQWGQNGMAALGKTLPNSFTTDRLMGAKLLGGLAASPYAAAQAGAAAGPIAAHAVYGLAPSVIGGAAIYSKAGNALTNKLMFGGGAGRAKIAQKVNSFLPAIGQGARATGAALGLQAAQKTAP